MSAQPRSFGGTCCSESRFWKAEPRRGWVSPQPFQAIHHFSVCFEASDSGWKEQSLPTGDPVPFCVWISATAVAQYAISSMLDSLRIGSEQKKKGVSTIPEVWRSSLYIGSSPKTWFKIATSYSVCLSKLHWCSVRDGAIGNEWVQGGSLAPDLWRLGAQGSSTLAPPLNGSV